MDLRVVGLVMVTSICLSACDIPRDPERTLAEVSGGTLRVGLSVNDPWTTIEKGDPSGIEVELVERLAERLAAEIEWTEGAEQELMSALELRELDLVIGGLTSESPWSAQATFTHPYLTTFVAVGVPEGIDPDDDIAGLEVAAEAGTEAAGLLRKTDAEVVTVTDIADAHGAAAVDSWLLDDLELTDTGVRLAESDHVMAVPHGENAWLSEIERFLLEDPDAIDALLERKGTL